MHRQMLVQVSFLREALLATRFAALERPLARVHAQVVEEVVPLAEEHVAVGMLAQQYLHIALGARVLVLVDCELTRRRYLLVDLDLAEVEGFA